MEINGKEIKKFQAICSENGVRVTPQRIELYRLLINNKNHPSVDRLYQALHKSHPTISFNTVYSSLQLFLKIGLVKETESYDGVKRYDSCLEEHGHFHCKSCGKIVDFEIQGIDFKVPDEIGNKHQVEHQKIILEGLCSECKKEKNKP